MKTQVAAILTACIVSGSCQKTKPQQEQKDETFVLSDTMLRSTSTAVATAEPLRNELQFYGKITADNNKLIEVYPIVGGNVIKVFVELGDYVKKGQVLATIRSTEVAGFEKELQDARNDVLVAQNNLKVAQELFEGKINAERDVVEAKGQLEKAQSQLGRIEEVYKIYNLKPGSVYQVTAPISGFIIEKKINQDMQLRSDRTDNIFDIAQIDDVWAIANVNETEIGQVQLGVNADVTTLSYPDTVFQGKVDKIFNIIDPETKAMKVRVKLNNASYLLKPEMRASIRIRYANAERMVAIPSEAVIFDNSRNYVLVFKSRFDIEVRPVEVFRTIGKTAYISTGINEGEKVITHNELMIYDALNDD